MHEKFYVILAYALMGLVIALWPLWVKENDLKISNASFLKPNTVIFSIDVIAIIILSWELVSLPIILSFGLIALLTSRSGGRFNIITMVLSFFSLCISATLPWWLHLQGPLDISIYQLSIFSFITLLFIRLYTTKVFVGHSKYPVVWIGIYMVFASILCFSTGIFNDSLAFLWRWHHWGAYVGPAELLLTGATLFNDFPVQYGLGPTALLASVCADDCWQGMYVITGFATLVFSVLVAVMAFSFCGQRWSERFGVLMLCLVTCFFWTAYPPSLGSPIMTPSVSGLRFLPVVALTTYLFYVKQIEYSKFRLFVAHGFWVLGALWSPESAFYVTFVWWPYYLLIQHGQGDFDFRIKGFIKAVLRLLLLAVALVIIFNTVFSLIYNERPTLYGFLAYALNPPGVMSINLRGAICYFLLASVIGLCTLWYSWRSAGDTLLFRRSFLVQLLSYSVFSYFLGRSHDNNVLNLLPFMLLVLLNALFNAESKFLVRMSAILTAALLAWLPVFGWQAWSENINAGRVLSFDFKPLRESMSFSSLFTQKKLVDQYATEKLDAGFPGDAGRAIDYLQQNYGEPITVLDFSWNMLGSVQPLVWNVIHGPANFAYIPSQRRQEFLLRIATFLKKSGWLVIDKKFLSDEILADFDFAYERTNRLEFGTYYAIRFSPKR